MAFTPSLGDRITRVIFSVIAALPIAVLRFFAGPTITIDGNELFVDVQLILRLLNLAPPADHTKTTIAQSRVRMDKLAWAVALRNPVRHVEDISIPTRAGSVPARVYNNVPAGKPILGSVVYFHGGGFVLGSLDSTDTICRSIASATDLVVVSVDYRLAPEHKFPAAIEDAVDAYAFVRADRNWGHLVACAGDSAGATIAAIVSNEATTACRNGGRVPPPDYQLLFFPVTDLTERRASYRTFGKGFFLSEAQVDWYTGQYLNSSDQLTDTRISPLVGDLTGVPPAHIAIGGYDVLRDECVAYYEKLKASGVKATLQLVTGHIHAFPSIAGVSFSAREALKESIGYLEKGMRQAAARGAEK
jgi:acetyl esterase